jgi:hypothetical protein
VISFDNSEVSQSSKQWLCDQYKLVTNLRIHLNTILEILILFQQLHSFYAKLKYALAYHVSDLLFEAIGICCCSESFLCSFRPSLKGTSYYSNKFSCEVFTKKIIYSRKYGDLLLYTMTW